MTDSLTSSIREYIYRNGPASAQAVAEAIPELASCGGEQRALLLMRLDPQLERVKGNLWVVRGVVISDDQRVKEAAERYFGSLDRPGAPLSSAVRYVSQETHIDPPKVEEALGKYYITHGPNIFHRPRRQEED